MDHDTTAAVSCTAVAKSYGAVRAVDGLDLTIRCGEKVALLGPNGAGKSTTVSMLLGLFPPDAGTVTVLGTTPERAVRAGRVGAMLQEGGLISRVTVRELMGFVARTPAPRCRWSRCSASPACPTWRTGRWTSSPAARRSGCGSPSR